MKNIAEIIFRIERETEEFSDAFKSFLLDRIFKQIDRLSLVEEYQDTRGIVEKYLTSEFVLAYVERFPKRKKFVLPKLARIDYILEYLEKHPEDTDYFLEITKFDHRHAQILTWKEGKK